MKHNLEQKLEELYLKKQEIEKEILELESTLKKEANTISRTLSKSEKIELFKDLFIGRSDIFAKKWKSKDGKREGFFPVAATFQGEDYLPLTNYEIEEHLRGNIFLASYLIDNRNLCKYCVFELNSEDVFKLLKTLSELSLKAYFSISSYNSIFAWIFFEEPISSKIVYNFLLFIKQKANINATLFPNKEFATKESLGKCLQLPLQLQYRNKNRTVFFDINSKKVFANQWQILQNIKKTKKEQVYKYSFFTESKNIETNQEKIEFPKHKLDLILNNSLYIPTYNLSKSFLSKLKSFASFENPQIKLLLSLRKPLYNTPKYIKSFDENENYLILPRGLINKVITFLNQFDIKFSIKDERIYKQISTKKLLFNLRPEQEDAIKEILKKDFSICVAPPGFGKTLIGAKAFEQRACKTLIVVNKNILLDQWISRFIEYFDYNKKEIGFLGKGQNKLNGSLDIATMQSLNNMPDIIKNYSFVIVDECHHIPALTFEQVIKNFQGRYILGLSATPNRKDELEPILHQQLGEISYNYKKKRTHANRLKVVRTDFVSEVSNYANLVNELCLDEKRNSLIIEVIKQNIDRKILLLTDRIEHVNILENMLKKENISYVAIHGSQNKKEQVNNMQKVKTSSLILATSSYFGEGIDFPHLNTILFATPISYHGRLIQYLGRIGRGSQECLAIDFLDSKNVMLNSSYKKRLEGYKVMHYN